MTFNWDHAIKHEDLSKINEILGDGRYVQAAERVKAMLTQCKGLLEENSNKIFAK